MSYQQTRSTQDPGFYPPNTSNGTLVLTNVNPPVTPAPASTGPGLAINVTAGPPSFDVRVYKGVMVAGVNQTFQLTPASPSEANAGWIFFSAKGTSGSFLTHRIDQVIGVDLVNEGGVTFTSTGGGFAVSNITGGGFFVLSGGGFYNLQINNTEASGQANFIITVMLNRVTV